MTIKLKLEQAVFIMEKQAVAKRLNSVKWH